MCQKKDGNPHGAGYQTYFKLSDQDYAVGG
jgi:hypothetical protein